MSYRFVDDSWNVKELRAECKGRGMVGYSNLNKAPLIHWMNQERHTAVFVDDSWYMKDLKAECKMRGMVGYAKMRKAPLIHWMNEEVTSSRSSSGHAPSAPYEGSTASTPPVNSQEPSSSRSEQVTEKKKCADQAYHSGSYETAHGLYSEVLGMVDEDDNELRAGLFANRAAALMNLGRNDDAVRDCQQALLLKQDYPKVWLRKGRLHRRLGEWGLAIEALETCCNSATVQNDTRQGALGELEQCREEAKREADDAARERTRAEEQARARANEPHGGQGENVRRSSRFHSTGHYGTLEVRSNATASELRKAYRRLALKHHPDKNLGTAASAERFKAINEAFHVLSDEVRRRDYDASLRDGSTRRPAG